jgi:hypothetical protein
MAMAAFFSRADGVGNGTGLGHHIAPGKDFLQSRRAGFIHRDGVLGFLQLRWKERQVWSLPDGRDHRVDGKGEVGVLDGPGFSPAVFSRRAEKVLEAFDPLDLPVFREDFHRGAQEDEFDLLFFRLGDLLLPGGHFLFGAAVEDQGFGAQAER